MKKILLILLFIPFHLFGADHYVAVGGGGTGTIGDPFATLAQLNAHALAAGDHVYFNRGDSWTVTTSGTALNIDTYSGTVTDSIFYGAYGEGANPIITGRQPITGWNVSGNWTNTSGNIWRMTADVVANVFGDNNRGRLWLDGVEVPKAESTTVPTALLPWTHNGQLLYVYSVGNPSGVFSNIESVGTLNWLVTLYRDYISISDIDFRGGGTELVLSGADHCLIRNCSIGADAGTTGLYAINSTYITIKGNTFDANDEIYDSYDVRVNSEEGIDVLDGCSDWNLFNNTFKNWGHAGFLIQLNDPAYTIKNIKFHHNFLTGPDVDYFRGLAYNIVNGAYGTCTGNEIFSNFIYNTTICNQISGDGLKFYNNIIDGVASNTYHIANEPYNAVGSGLVISPYRGTTSNNEIYNNVIMNCYDYGLFITQGDYDVEDNLIKNNIVINNDYANNFQLRYDIDLDDVSSNTLQNNLFYKSGVTDLFWYIKANNTTTNRVMNLATFNSMNGNTAQLYAGVTADIIENNIGGDPLFVDAVNANYLLRDYHLSEGSPAIGAGIAVGLTYDYDSVLYLATPSIGALEYGSAPEDPDPPELPTIITNPVTTIKSIQATFAGTSAGTSITDRGVCWSTSINPSLSGSHAHIGTGEGSFTYFIGNLLSGTTYHVRSFATNSEGTVYGADVEFTTPAYSSVGSSTGVLIYQDGKLVIIK